LGDLLKNEGDRDRALVAYQEAGEIFRELNDRRGLAWVELALSGYHLEAGRLPEAGLKIERALALAREIGESYGESAALNAKATLALVCGDLHNVREFAGQSLARNRLLREPFLVSEALMLLGYAAQVEGYSERAARLFGMAEKNQQSMFDLVKHHLDQAVSAVKAALGGEAFARLYAEGQATYATHSLETLIESVLESEYPAAGSLPSLPYRQDAF
jgi:tetratricopeptide (TPR) repeat protein